MSRAAMLVAGLLVFSLGTQATAEPVCKPVLMVKDVGFSEMINLKRFWTATVDVDASMRDRIGAFCPHLRSSGGECAGSRVR